MENKKLIEKNVNPYREVLKKVAAGLLIEVGFTSVNTSAIEKLVDVFESLLISISQSTRDYTEFARRTEPTIGDITLALIDNGIKFENIQKFAVRPRRITTLKANEKNKHPEPLPTKIPLPPMHAYIRTDAYAKPPMQYEDLRTKTANNKRGIDMALSKYLARTSKNTFNLFDDGNEKFLVVSGLEKSSVPAYLSALNPTDQIFDFEELEYYYELRNAVDEQTAERHEVDKADSNNNIEFDVSPRRENSQATSQDPSSQSEIIDKPAYENPFMKLIK